MAYETPAGKEITKVTINYYKQKEGVFNMDQFESDCFDEMFCNDEDVNDENNEAFEGFDL